MKVATLTIQAERGVDLSLGYRSECSASRVRLTMDGNYSWDSVPLEPGLGVVECERNQDLEKS